MITNIGLDCINSFKKLSALKTDKRINLIYGLNGTGKSTLTNFLYDKDDEEYQSCSIEGLNDQILLVYNQRFIQDTFYQPDNLKGIFTISKENKEAVEKIKIANNEVENLENKKSIEIERQNKKILQQNTKRRKVEDKVWEIKTNYTGGDRILEFCLEGLKASKEKQFDYILSLPKPEQKPIKTTDILKKETEALQGETARKYSPVPNIDFKGHEVESNKLFQKEIIGNKNSAVAELIQKLNNSDWVKEGLDYLPEIIDDNGSPCPFCQKNTITKAVASDIKDFFDETYESDIDKLNTLLDEYQLAINSIKSKENYEENPFIGEKKADFELLYNAVIKVSNDNKREIDGKLKTPSKKVTLIDSSENIKSLNQFISEINKKTDEHNSKIDNKDAALNKIKNTFWEIMRWDFDQTLSNFEGDNKSLQDDLKDIKKIIDDVDNDINVQRKIISDQQKNTVNIDEAINNINNGLLDLGIDDFQIKKHSDVLYKIVREEKINAPFQTLSEGEKMIISFLYFRELCKGKKSATEVDNKKIVVIDDPISSLSHIFIFNIGQMIKNDFFKSENYEQVFVLTHSLYFFYELTDKNHDRRKENQTLFRMIKNNDGSQIFNMKYREIQNDYHSYWHIIKDERQPPALIANCMRNIVEYFFNFVEMKDLNAVFQKEEFQNNKYQAFMRYIDRESHSDWQNIFDFKEFNYNDFKEGLGLLFKESGYAEHYEEMIK